MSDDMLRIERVFDAPREMVWNAFTDPDEVAQWFGPVGYRVPRESIEFDLRPGGRQRLSMVAEDQNQPSPGESTGTIDEFVDGALLATYENLEGEIANVFGTERLTMRIELHDEPDGRTRLILTQGPYGEAILGDAAAGWGSSFDKLDAVLGLRTGKLTVAARGDLEIVVRREFAAPPDAIYRAWTEAELLRQWWPGLRGTMTEIEVDARVGGRWRSAMRTHGGMEVVFYGEYLELVPGERIVTTEVYEPFPESPTTNTLTLTPAEGGTLAEIVILASSTQARDMQLGSGMESGMAEGFDLIEKLVA